MSGLAHYFESEGLSTVLVGFVREHIEAIKPPRSLFLDFPMGRGMGTPNAPAFQKKVIRAAFDLFDAPAGPVIADFPEVIPVKDGRMGYALPPELVLSVDDIGGVEAVLAEVTAEMEALRPDYDTAVAERGRTTVGASGLAIEDFAPFVAGFLDGEIPQSPRKGMPAITLLKLVVEDLEAYFTEPRTHRDNNDDLELIERFSFKYKYPVVEILLKHWHKLFTFASDAGVKPAVKATIKDELFDMEQFDILDRVGWWDDENRCVR